MTGSLRAKAEWLSYSTTTQAYEAPNPIGISMSLRFKGKKCLADIMPVGSVSKLVDLIICVFYYLDVRTHWLPRIAAMQGYIDRLVDLYSTMLASPNRQLSQSAAMP
ncbi:hypothetical protein [Bradyrhizobium sp. USDA 4451]